MGLAQRVENIHILLGDDDERRRKKKTRTVFSRSQVQTVITGNGI